jgi:transcriptional regulator with XRE-family HTH domain
LTCGNIARDLGVCTKIVRLGTVRRREAKTLKFSSEQMGWHLRIARKRAGLTQEEVARQLDMRRPSISEIEWGRRSVKVHELEAMAKLYRVRPEFLTRGTGPKDGQVVALVSEELAGLNNTDLDRLGRAIQILKTSRR